MRRFVVAILSLSLLAASCRSTSEVVSVPVHDTVGVVSVVHDSVFVNRFTEVSKMNDTVFVRDSILMTRWHVVADTLYRTRKVFVPYEVEKIVEVEKPLSVFQRLLMGFGWLFVGLVVASLFWLWRKKFK